jgi:dsRNA-specific ribonuclease
LTVRGVVVGEGVGTSIIAAKRAAAAQALQYFDTHEIPE